MGWRERSEGAGDALHCIFASASGSRDTGHLSGFGSAEGRLDGGSGSAAPATPAATACAFPAHREEGTAGYDAHGEAGTAGTSANRPHPVFTDHDVEVRAIVAAVYVAVGISVAGRR